MYVGGGLLGHSRDRGHHLRASASAGMFDRVTAAIGSASGRARKETPCLTSSPPGVSRRLLLRTALLVWPLAALADIELSINIAPPPLPVYEQPPVPTEGYLWTPGYWMRTVLRVISGCRALGCNRLSRGWFGRPATGVV
jgi:hypothetical protein